LTSQMQHYHDLHSSNNNDILDIFEVAHISTMDVSSITIFVLPNKLFIKKTKFWLLLKSICC